MGARLQLHLAGHATPGDGMGTVGAAERVLEIGGPRGSAVLPPVLDWWLLVGDETAPPAIGRWIEQMPAGTRVTRLVAVSSGIEEHVINSRADCRAL
jgi:NADPH-dependent ferric siderophore reductase